MTAYFFCLDGLWDLIDDQQVGTWGGSEGFTRLYHFIFQFSSVLIGYAIPSKALHVTTTSVNSADNRSL